MMVYKWTIKKDNKYFSLVNFNIHPSLKKVFPAGIYELNKIYSNYIKDLRPINLQKRCNVAGFHFWKKPKLKSRWKQYNYYLIMKGQPEINAILKCEINQEDIITEDIERLVTKKFKVLEEVNE